MSKTKTSLNSTVSPKVVAIVFGVLVLLFALGFYISAWTEPGHAPPGGNVAAPLNVSGTAQTKTGSLTAGGYTVQGWDAVYKSLDTGGGADKTFQLIGTYHGWDSEAIYIPGYNYYNPAGSVNNSYAKRVHFGHPEKMTIDLNAGNVGIGTTEPDSKLHIFGNSAGTVTATANSILTVENSAAAHISILTPATSAGLLVFGNPNDNDEAWVRYDHNTGNMDFRVNAGIRATIDSSGNVGIGTTNPTQKLDVVGYVKGTGLCIGDVCKNNWADVAGTGYWALLNICEEGGACTGLLYPNLTGDYRVGIGTANPNDKLEVRNGNIVVNNQAGGWKSELKSAGPLYLHPDYDQSGDDDVYITDSAGNAWAVFNRNGNVGIGTNNPPNKLHVNGNIGATGWIGAGCEGSCNSSDGYALMYASGEIRGSVLKDINDMNYFVDPNSTSRQYRINANVLDFSHSADARTAADGVLFRYGGQAAMAFDDWFRMYDSNNGQLRIEFNIDDASVRANRYYDRNSTGYYVDPASNSQLNNIFTSGGKMQWGYSNELNGIAWINYRNDGAINDVTQLNIGNGSHGGYGSVKAADFCTNSGKCLSSAGIDLHGWSFQNDKLLDDGENVIQTSDEWLRLNQQKQFTNGVYTPGLIRADGGFQVDGYEMIGSNADKLYANRRNTTGGGIWVSDDGGFYDYNDGWIRFVGSHGIDMNNKKLHNVSEIDPVFNINGKKYVTYMPDSIGQKVEVVGRAKLKGDKLEIDLAKQKEGSDLWLFWQVVKQDTIIPFVSPQSDADLYAYINGSKLVVKLRIGEKNAKFSYRLIGTRLDHANDQDNLYNDQNVESYINIDELRK